MVDDSSIRLVVRVSAETKDRLKDEAKKKNTTPSDLVRQYIEKGLSVDGYKDSMSMISELTEQSLKNVLLPQIERMVKLMMKLGKINGAGYYMQLANLVNAKDRQGVETMLELVQNCNKLAINYMSQQDSNVDTFLLKNKEIVDKAIRLKNPIQGYVND